MARVSFTQNLKRHVNVPSMDVGDAGTVREALDVVFRDHPKLRGYVLDDQNRLRKHVVVFVDGEIIEDRAELSDPVPSAGEVFVMQALSGG